MSEVKQSLNKVQLHGTEKELNLAVSTKEVLLKKNKDDNGTKVTCKVIEKVEFKNPSFTIEVNGNDIPVEVRGVGFGITEKRFDADGNMVDNKIFKSIETMIEKWAVGQRVTVDGSLGLNEYASTAKDANGIFYSSQEVVTPFGASTTNVSEDDSADAEITGVIKNIAHEVKGDDETGRLNVELISFGYNGVAEPYKFVVESDLASDFESFYEIGSSVKVAYEIITKQVGAVRTESVGGFGRRDAKITSGYKVTEYSIFRGEEPFDEEHEYFVSTDVVKEKLEEREIYIENVIKKAVEKAQNSGANTTKSPKGASQSSNNNPFGNSTTKANPFGGETKSKAKNPFA